MRRSDKIVKDHVSPYGRYIIICKKGLKVYEFTYKEQEDRSHNTIDTENKRL